MTFPEPEYGMSIYDYCWENLRGQERQIVLHESGLHQLAYMYQLQQQGIAEASEHNHSQTQSSARNAARVELALANLTDQIRYVGRDIREGLDRVTTTVTRGFDRIGAKIDITNDYLRQLVENTGPNRWSYVKYANACKAFFKLGDYGEALREIDYALYGEKGSSETGYRLDPDFFYLRGQIRIGNWKQPAPDSLGLIQFDIAESAFLNVARLCQQNTWFAQAKKGEGLLWAARAAHLAGEPRRAAEYAQLGLQRLQTLRDDFLNQIALGKQSKWEDAGRFALRLIEQCQTSGLHQARYLCASGGDSTLVEDVLGEVFRTDVERTVEAQADPIIAQQGTALAGALREITALKLNHYEAGLARCREKEEAISGFDYCGLAATAVLDKEFTALTLLERKAMTIAVKLQPLDLDAAARILAADLPKFDGLFEKFVTAFSEREREHWQAEYPPSVTERLDLSEIRPLRTELDNAQKRWAHLGPRQSIGDWSSERLGCFLVILFFTGFFLCLGLLLPLKPWEHTSDRMNQIIPAFFGGVIAFFMYRPVTVSQSNADARDRQIGELNGRLALAEAKAQAKLQQASAAAEEAWQPHLKRIEALRLLEPPF